MQRIKCYIFHVKLCFASDLYNEINMRVCNAFNDFIVCDRSFMICSREYKIASYPKLKKDDRLSSSEFWARIRPETFLKVWPEPEPGP